MPEMNSFGFGSQSASGHQAIINEFDQGKRTKYLDRTIWRHRCGSIIPQISDQSWFDQVDDMTCQDELLYKLQPTGIKISGLRSYNQKLKSHTPKQTTQKMNFGEWLYSQMKWSKMELNEKCDEDSYMMDVEKAFRIELDDYIERLALLRMSCISSCWNSSCTNVGIPSSSPSTPLKIDVTNSHQLPSRADQIKKAACDDRGYFMIWPSCEKGVLAENEVVKKQYEGCCSLDVPAITGNAPSFGSKTKMIFSDHVPYTTCADGSRVYKIIHAPFGSFGYASILADSEVVDSDSLPDDWAKIHRMIVRFGMIIPVPWDYSVFHVRIKQEDLPLETCS